MSDLGSQSGRGAAQEAWRGQGTTGGSGGAQEAWRGQGTTGGPGTPGGGGWGTNPPPRQPARPAPTRSLLWVLAAVAIIAILAGAHRITSNEVILFCMIVPSIILHELSHGVVALAFGDDTAQRAGRLTLNPLAHVDLLGTIIVPALMALSGYGFFGWAKPVPVNVGRLKHARNSAVVVSLAGPFTNVLLATLAGLLFAGLGGSTAFSGNTLALWARILFYLGLVNIALAAFNLIPVPPLDGSVVLERMLPRAWWPGYLRFRRYTMPILVVLVIINFYLHPGPITWLYDHLFNWWANVLHVG